MKQITLRVQEEVKESLEDEAADDGQTLSEYMRTLIEHRDEDTEDATEYQYLTKHPRLAVSEA